MKRSTMVLLLAVAVILIAAGIIIDAVMGRDYRPDTSDYRTLYETEDGGVTEIRAEMLSSALRVYESSNDERLEISVSGRAGSSVSVKREGNVLTITEDSVPGSGARLSKEDWNDYAVIWLPEDFAGTLELSSASGELSMSDVDIPEASVTLSAVSGETSVYDSKFSSLTIESVSGDVWFGSIKVNSMTVSTVSGDIRGSVKGLDGEPRIETYTVSGDVSINE